MDLSDDPVPEPTAGGAGAGPGAPPLSLVAPPMPPYHIAPTGVPLEYLTPPESAFREFPGLKRIGPDQPPFFTCPNFLSDAECDALIEMGRPALKASIVVDGAAGKTTLPSRTSRSCFLKKSDTVWVAERIAKLTGQPIGNQEPPQIANYQPSQMYKPHFDAFDMTTGPGRECALTGGQRTSTVLVYLNTNKDGGGTNFPTLDITFKPTRGTMVMFFPCDKYGRLDSLALHSGEPAHEEKWLFQVWSRQSHFG